MLFLPSCIVATTAIRVGWVRNVDASPIVAHKCGQVLYLVQQVEARRTLEPPVLLPEPKHLLVRHTVEETVAQNDGVARQSSGAVLVSSGHQAARAHAVVCGRAHVRQTGGAEVVHQHVGDAVVRRRRLEVS